MLQDRIISTLKFFDLQDMPLTSFELHKYLLADSERIRQQLDSEWEVVNAAGEDALAISLATVSAVLSEECAKENSDIKLFRGYYYLKQRDESFVWRRLQNYIYAVNRERRLQRYGAWARHVPFIRGIGLVGSQAMGQYRPQSDIDILVFTEPGFMWTARVAITIYLQVFGVRRYGSRVANRFCLNHYVAGPKELTRDRNIYTASEYLKMRPLYPSQMLEGFKERNLPWIKIFFPHAISGEKMELPQSKLQRTIEYLLDNRVGQWMERQFQRVLVRRINQDDFVVVENDELAFHPHNRKARLFSAFFKG